LGRVSRPGVEGTIGIEGLIEGKLTGADDVQRVREWVAFAKTHGLCFSLEVDGSSFSLLADTGSLAVARLGGDAAGTVRRALLQLARAFEDVASAGLFSTLRSREFRPGTEVQTLYVFRTGGEVLAQERCVDAETVSPARPRTRRETVRLVLLGLLVFAVVIGVSTLFVDYGALFTQVTGAALPIDAEKIEIRRGALREYLEVEAIRARRLKSGFEVTLRISRGAAYPKDGAALGRALRDVAGYYERRLCLEAIARGYARCEFFDEKGAYLGFFDTRIDLAGTKSATVQVLVAGRTRPARIVLRY